MTRGMARERARGGESASGGFPGLLEGILEDIPHRHTKEDAREHQEPEKDQIL